MDHRRVTKNVLGKILELHIYLQGEDYVLVLYWITDFWLGISKKVNNIISTSLKNTLFQKITGAWLEKWACHTDFEISGSKIEKGVAGSVFKPHPCNFWIWMIFYRFSNDISNIFLYLHCMNRTELQSSSEKS